jgi:hypothetical protein
MLQKKGLEKFNAFTQLEQVGSFDQQQLFNELVESVKETESTAAVIKTLERSTLTYDVCLVLLALFSLFNLGLACLTAIYIQEINTIPVVLMDTIIGLTALLGTMAMVLNRVSATQIRWEEEKNAFRLLKKWKARKAELSEDIFYAGLDSGLISTEKPLGELTPKQKTKASALLTRQITKYLKLKQSMVGSCTTSSYDQAKVKRLEDAQLLNIEQTDYSQRGNGTLYS